LTVGDKERLVVIGGVAAGMSAASQAKRRKPELEVVVFEKGPWVSYGACGMPYNIQDPARKIDDLVVISAERFRTERNIDVRTKSEVTEVDLKARAVRVERPDGESKVEFDHLVIATGCKPTLPGFRGVDLDGVFTLHNLEDADRIKRYLADSTLKKAVVIGGGHIGLEMADVLTARGLAVSVVKRSPALPPGYPEELTTLVRGELERYGVELHTGVKVVGFEGAARVERMETDKGALGADIVIVATGVRPEVALAEKAGIKLADSGTIAVDERMATSAGEVFAAGDCAEAYHRLLGKGVFVPRGTTANKQGRVAGANVVGGGERFSGVMGTSITKVFGLEVGHTGLFEDEARAAGHDPAATLIKARTRAHAYPGSKDISVRLVFDKGSGKLLGAQIVGGENVAKRIDIIATAVQAGFSVDDLSRLDLSYAPPFAPVWDPILVAANIARKKTGG